MEEKFPQGGGSKQRQERIVGWARPAGLVGWGGQQWPAVGKSSHAQSCVQLGSHPSRPIPSLPPPIHTPVREAAAACVAIG